MIKSLFIASIYIVFIGCAENRDEPVAGELRMPIEGTWRLLNGTLIENGDTLVTEYSGNRSFIKVINQTHFAFLNHDTNKGKDSLAVFGAGGGRYTLHGNSYKEHLEYCSDRSWEGHQFTFIIQITGDTLVQSGAEKIESEGINRTNIERYVRVKRI